jgi:hypothetical protein
VPASPASIKMHNTEIWPGQWTHCHFNIMYYTVYCWNVQGAARTAKFILPQPNSYIYKTIALTVFHMVSSSQLCTHFLFPPSNYVFSVLETYFTNVKKTDDE